VQKAPQRARRPGGRKRCREREKARQRAQALAAALLWEDTLTDERIAARCGVCRRTLARWKRLAFVQTVFRLYGAAREERRRRGEAAALVARLQAERDRIMGRRRRG